MTHLRINLKTVSVNLAPGLYNIILYELSLCSIRLPVHTGIYCALQVRNCRLVGLLDLKLSSEYVRGKVISYLNRLVDIGVAGFRVDAVKHMWPGDTQAIYDAIHDLSTNAGFTPHTRPFIFNEASCSPRYSVRVMYYF